MKGSYRPDLGELQDDESYPMNTPKLKPSDVNYPEDSGPFAPKPEPLRCGFCYDREQGKHGEVKREWSPEWLQYIPVCRKHALADGMDASGSLIQ